MSALIDSLRNATLKLKRKSWNSKSHDQKLLQSSSFQVSRNATGSSIRKTKSEMPKNMTDVKEVHVELTIKTTSNESRVVHAIGNNKFGKLGSGTAENVASLQQVFNACDVASGDYHTALLDTHGHVQTLGTNHKGLLGVGKGSKESHTPVQVPLLPTIVKIVCGSNYTIALSNTGELYGWGANSSGSLGLGDSDIRYTPEKISFTKTVVDVKSGGHHVIAQVNGGAFYSWGANSNCELGQGHDLEIVNTPHQILAIRGYQHRISQFEMGHRFAVLLTDNGVYSFGSNQEGQLGLGNTVNQAIPQEILSLRNQRVTSIACGNCSAYAVTSEGRLFAWGSNNYFQLGLSHDTLVPVQVQVSPISCVFASHIDTHVVLKTRNNQYLEYGKDEKGDDVKTGLDTLAGKNIIVRPGWFCTFVLE
jgi:alpha-tubulin suppressor-like RCC1 family protein